MRRGRAGPFAADDRRHGPPRQRGTGLDLHRDNARPPPRSSSSPRRTRAAGRTGVKPQHTLVFLSADGGASGGLGAAGLRRHAPRGEEPRRGRQSRYDCHEWRRRGSRSPGRAALALADAPRLGDRAARRARRGKTPARPSLFGQLVDLAFPFSLYEQWPFLQHGISAITLTTAGDRPSSDPAVGRLDAHAARPDRCRRRSRSSPRSTRASSSRRERAATSTSAGGSSHGWAIALVLIALVVPFAVAAVDLFARCRRRHVPLGPAFRAYRRRLGFWLWVGVVFGLFALFGAFPDGAAVPPDPASSAAGDWPRRALLLFVIARRGELARRARRRLAPRRPATSEEELAGQTAALLVLGLISLLVMATNVYALAPLPAVAARVAVAAAGAQPLRGRARARLRGRSARAPCSSSGSSRSASGSASIPPGTLRS